jgi:hypothetical protein
MSIPNFVLVLQGKTPIVKLPKRKIKDEFFDLNTQQFMEIKRLWNLPKETEYNIKGGYYGEL